MVTGFHSAEHYVLGLSVLSFLSSQYFNNNKRTGVLYHPPPSIRLDFLRSQIVKRSIFVGHFKFPDGG